MKKWIIRLIVMPLLIFGGWRNFAWWVGIARLSWDFCPCCNSDAPLLYNCPVCRHYREPWPPSQKQKEAWKQTFWKWLYRSECWQRSMI